MKIRVVSRLIVCALLLTLVGSSAEIQAANLRSQRRTGITPDAFALSGYDALFVVQFALVHADPQKNFDNFKAAFVDEAGHYQGVTGSTALDPADDRLNGDFDFWAVRPQNGSYSWVRIGSYNNGVLSLF